MLAYPLNLLRKAVYLIAGESCCGKWFKALSGLVKYLILLFGENSFFEFYIFNN
jgi:hypothetical protein